MNNYFPFRRHCGTISATLMAESGTDPPLMLRQWVLKLTIVSLTDLKTRGRFQRQVLPHLLRRLNEIFGIFIEDSVASSAITSGDASVSAEAIGYSEAVVSYVTGIN